MPKKKKELTAEEILLQTKQSGINFMESKIHNYTSEPTYYFNIGDEVTVGNLKNCRIDEIYHEGKFYGITCDREVRDTYGKHIPEPYYIVTAWTEVKPCVINDDNGLVKNQDLHLYFSNRTIDSLIHSYYNFGIDMNPDYQRDYVWTNEDKEKLIQSIFENVDIGKFILRHLNTQEYYEKNKSYEIIDGKQRLSALIEFYENRLEYKGCKFNDLSPYERHVFEEHNISVAEVENVDRKTSLQYFIMMNTCGKSMSEDDIQKAKDLYDKE